MIQNPKFKLFLKANFLNVDAERLAAGYRKERKGHKERKKERKKEILNLTLLQSKIQNPKSKIG